MRSNFLIATAVCFVASVGYAQSQGFARALRAIETLQAKTGELQDGLDQAEMTWEAAAPNTNQFGVLQPTFLESIDDLLADLQLQTASIQTPDIEAYKVSLDDVGSEQTRCAAFGRLQDGIAAMEQVNVQFNQLLSTLAAYSETLSKADESRVLLHRALEGCATYSTSTCFELWQLTLSSRDSPLAVTLGRASQTVSNLIAAAEDERESFDQIASRNLDGYVRAVGFVQAVYKDPCKAGRSAKRKPRKPQHTGRPDSADLGELLESLSKAHATYHERIRRSQRQQTTPPSSSKPDDGQTGSPRCARRDEC